MEALDRESLRAFLYGMDVGDCATIGGTIPRREEEMDLGFGSDRPWWNIFAPCESRAWPMRFVAQSMKSILDASPLLWNVNWSFRRWSKCQTFNFYSLFLHTFSFYPSSRIIFTLHLEHWLFDRQMEREWIRRLVKSLGDLIFYIRIVIKSLQDSRELNIWNVELKCE